jgi:ankyrin repeat protein
MEAAAGQLVVAVKAGDLSRCISLIYGSDGCGLMGGLSSPKPHQRETESSQDTPQRPNVASKIVARKLLLTSRDDEDEPDEEEMLVVAPPPLDPLTAGLIAAVAAFKDAHEALVCCKLLLLAGASIDGRAKLGGDTAVIAAARTGRADILGLLLGDARAGVVVGSLKSASILNAQNKKGTTAIIAAAAEGHIGCLTMLIEFGTGIIDVNTASISGWTALITAAKKGDLDTVKLLIVAKGVSPLDLNLADTNGLTPLMCAAESGHTDIVTLLLCAKNTASVVNLNATNAQGNTALILAVQNNNPTCVMSLLNFEKEGADPIDVNIKDDLGSNALMYAAEYGNPLIIAALLSERGLDTLKVNVNDVSKKGRSPLILSTYHNHPGITKLLLDVGANPDTLDYKHHTAYYYASTKYHVSYNMPLLRRLLKVKSTSTSHRSPSPTKHRTQGGRSPSPTKHRTQGGTAHAHASVAADAFCPIHDAVAFVSSLGLSLDWFDAKATHQCFCLKCYTGVSNCKDTGPTRYAAPRGWVRFGIKGCSSSLTPLSTWDAWCTSFHGLKSVPHLGSILQSGTLIEPGARLTDGSTFESIERNDGDAAIYTSPTIRYAGKKCFAEPQKWGTVSSGASADGADSEGKPGDCKSTEMRGSIVVQCKQRPGSFTKQSETIHCEEYMPFHLKEYCGEVDQGTIEWKTEASASVIPFAMLVRVWPKEADTEGEAYSSPLDGGTWWDDEGSLWQ